MDVFYLTSTGYKPMSQNVRESFVKKKLVSACSLCAGFLCTSMLKSREGYMCSADTMSLFSNYFWNHFKDRYESMILESRQRAINEITYEDLENNVLKDALYFLKTLSNEPSSPVSLLKQCLFYLNQNLAHLGNKALLKMLPIELKMNIITNNYNTNLIQILAMDDSESLKKWADLFLRENALLKHTVHSYINPCFLRQYIKPKVSLLICDTIYECENNPLIFEFPEFQKLVIITFLDEKSVRFDLFKNQTQTSATLSLNNPQSSFILEFDTPTNAWPDKTIKNCDVFMTDSEIRVIIKDHLWIITDDFLKLFMKNAPISATQVLRELKISDPAKYTQIITLFFPFDRNLLLTFELQSPYRPGSNRCYLVSSIKVTMLKEKPNYWVIQETKSTEIRRPSEQTFAFVGQYTLNTQFIRKWMLQKGVDMMMNNNSKLIGCELTFYYFKELCACLDLERTNLETLFNPALNQFYDSIITHKEYFYRLYARLEFEIRPKNLPNIYAKYGNDPEWLTLPFEGFFSSENNKSKIQNLHSLFNMSKGTTNSSMDVISGVAFSDGRINLFRSRNLDIIPSNPQAFNFSNLSSLYFSLPIAKSDEKCITVLFSFN